MFLSPPHPATAADTRRRQLLSNATTLPASATLPGSASGPGVTLAAVPNSVAADPVYQAAMEGAAKLGDDEGLTPEEALEVQAFLDAELASELALAPAPAPGPSDGEGEGDLDIQGTEGELELEVSQMSMGMRMASPNTLVAWM